MATTYKNAGIAADGTISTYSTLYNTGAGVSAVISSILIVNTSSTGQTVRIGIMSTEGSPGAGEWLVYDYAIAANDTVILTMGVTMSENQYMRVSASSNTVTYRAFISEIS